MSERDKDWADKHPLFNDPKSARSAFRRKISPDELAALRYARKKVRRKRPDPKQTSIYDKL